MAKSLTEWVTTEVQGLQHKPVSWLSQYHFFRDPCRPTFSNTSYFLSPADGIILYQKTVEPDESIIDIKGKAYSLRDAIRDKAYDKRSLVIGIFLTFFDVHICRVPFPGRLSHRELEAIDTFNHPMIDLEDALLNDLHIAPHSLEYLHYNQRMVNRVYAPQLKQSYYILQIADYDIDSILPFRLKQNQPYAQGQRFSQIRYGSQVDLIVPLSGDYGLSTVQPTGFHVEAGADALIRVELRRPARESEEAERAPRR